MAVLSWFTATTIQPQRPTKKKLRSAHLDIQDWRTQLNPSNQLFHELVELELRVLDEKETNTTEGRRKLGYAVTYGAIVQFQHEASHKFVTQTKNRAEQDRLAMQVSLINSGTEGSWWKVLPAEKVRTEGERVRYGDKVILENAKFGNSFLFVALGNALLFNNDAHPYIRLNPSVKARYEVNASAHTTAFQIRLIRKHQENRCHDCRDSLSSLLGMDVVTIYHREQDSVLCADDADGRGRVFWMPALIWKQRSGMAINGTMWRVLAECVDGGGACFEGDSPGVVIQHVASGLYLAQVEGRVELNPSLHRSKCLWSLRAHSTEGHGDSRRFASGDIVWLRHESRASEPAGGGASAVSWLSVLDEEGGSEGSPVVGAGQVDSELGGLQAAVHAAKAPRNADVLEVTVLQEWEWKASTLLCGCKEILKAALHCVQGMEPVTDADVSVPEGVDPLTVINRGGKTPEELIQLAVDHPHLRPHAAAMRKTVCECLDVLAHLCMSSTGEGLQRRSRSYNQDLVRAAGLIDLAYKLVVSFVDELKLPVRKIQAHLPDVHAICSKVYAFILCAIEGHAANKRSLQRHSNDIMLHIPGNFGTYLVTKQILSGSREMLENQEEYVWARWFNILKSERSSRMAKFLAETCCADGFPLRSNQDRVTREVFVGMRNLVCSMRIGDDEAVMIDHAGDEPVRISLTEMLMIDETWEDRKDYESLTAAQKVFIFQLEMLELMSWCAFGRNEFACALLQEHAEQLGVRFEELLAAVKSNIVPDQMRQKCCNLLIRLHIDRDPYEPVSMAVNARVWTGSLYGRIPAPSEWDGIQPEYQPNIRELCNEIKRNAPRTEQLAAVRDAIPTLFPDRTSVDSVQRNNFTLALLDCVIALVEFGHYSTFDPRSASFGPDFAAIQQLVPSLLKTLDGRGDVCAPFGNFSAEEARFQESEKTLAVMHAKLKALQILHSFFRSAESERITRFTRFWEGMLARLGLDSPEKVNHLLQSQAVTEVPHCTGSEGKQGKRNSLIGWRQRYKVVPRGSIDHEMIEDMVRDQQLWTTAPPWTEAELDALAQDIFSTESQGGVFSQNHIQKMFEGGNASYVPEWIKVLLDLVRYQHAPLKETSIAFLLATFSARANLIRTARSTIFIWEDDPATLFLRVRTEISRLRSLRKSIGSRNLREGEEACQQASELLAGWVRACTFPARSNAYQKLKVQNVLASLGALDAALQCIHAPLTRQDGQQDAGARRVFCEVYAFLAKVVERNEALQKELLKYWELLIQHVVLLDGEAVLEAMLHNNPAVIRDIGPTAIRFAFDAITVKKRHRAGWVVVLMRALKCDGNLIKDNLALALMLFRKSEEAMGMVMKTDSAWDRRIKLMTSGDLYLPCGNSQLQFHLSVIRMLALAGEGKNPAYEVFAAHYFSLRDLIHVLLRPTVDSKGVEHRVPHAVLATVKQSFIKMFHEVYVDPVVVRLEEELMREENGLWSIAAADRALLGDCPLMHALKHEIQVFADQLKRFGGTIPAAGVDTVLAVGRYICLGVLPMLQDYFDEIYPRLKGSEDHKKTAQELFDVSKELFEAPFPPEMQTLDVDGETVDGRECAFDLVNVMMKKSHIGLEWAQLPSLEVYVPRETTSEVSINQASETVAASLERGYATLVNQLARRFGILDIEKNIGTGLLQMAMMFCRQGEVPLYEGEELSEPGHSRASNPKYYEFVVAMIDSSLSETTESTILRDILRVVTGMVYVDEPLKPDRTVEDCIEHWHRFLHLEAVVKEVEPRKPMLRWVQDRIDAMGATEAALRLLSNHNKMVQLSAVALLASLLQGTNRRVQRTIRSYTIKHKNGVLFKVMSEAVDTALEGLKEHRRYLKLASRSDTKGTVRSGFSTRTDGEELGKALGFGKSSMIMLTLRLIQLMCKGQYTSLQNMMLEQNRTGNSFNVVQRLVDLFEALQPLISLSLAHDNGDIALLAIQLLDTLKELLMGPNEKNQRYVLGTSFLAVCNRFFSSTCFVSLPDDAPKLKGTDMTSNDMRCFLKCALIDACHAMLEGSASKESRFLAKVLDNFETRNLYAQVLEAGQVLGLVSLSVDAVSADTQVQDGDGTWRSARGALTQPLLKRVGSAQAYSGRPDGSGRDSGKGTARSGKEGPGTVAANKRMRQQATRLKLSKGYEKTVENSMFGLYFLMKTLVEYDHDSGLSQRMEELATLHNDLVSFLERHCSTVEISHTKSESGKRLVEVVHFRISDDVRKLTLGKGFRKVAENAMFDVPRDNPQEKAKAFIRRLHQIRRLIQHLLFIGGHPASRFLIRNKAWLDQAPLVLAALITLGLLLFYGVPIDPNTNDILADGIYHQPISTVRTPPAGYSQGRYPYPELTSDPDGIGEGYGSILRASDLALKYRMSLRSRWESKAEWELFPAGKYLLWFMGLLHLLLAFTNAVITMVEQLPLKIQNVLEAHMVLPDGTPSATVLATGITGAAYLKNPPSIPTMPTIQWAPSLFLDLLKVCRTGIYHGLLVSVSLLGLISSPLFFVFLTLDFLRTRGGRLVMQAVLHGAPNLVRSFVLGVIVLVCFGFYSYAYFSQTVNISQELCHSPFQCVAKHLLDSMTGDLTTVLGDDFGNFGYPSMVVWKDSWNSWRSFFLFCSIVFWVFLLQGIIQGQIIDAFAEKRNHDFYLKEDLEKKCFVSSIDRFVFNSYPGEWEKRRGGKYAWNYLLFFTQLAYQDEEEYNGLENMVSQSFGEGGINFLPIEQLAVRQRGDMAAEGKDMLQELLERMDGMSNHLEKLDGLSARMTQFESQLFSVQQATSTMLSAMFGRPGDTDQNRRGSVSSEVDSPRLASQSFASMPVSQTDWAAASRRVLQLQDPALSATVEPECL